MKEKQLLWGLLALFFLAGLLFVAGCEDDASTDKSAPTTSMEFPQSLTGAEVTPPALTRGLMNPRAVHNGDIHCGFEGVAGDDPFRDGYNMTKFLVSAVATWQCFADSIIIIVAAIPFPTDGTFVEFDPDPSDPDGPTGIRVTDNSSNQRTIELFFNGNTTTAGVYLSWSFGTNFEGKLILSSVVMNDPSDPGFDADEPNNLRMDFSNNGTTQTADMIISFPGANLWAEAFRITAVKTLADDSFVVRGIMDMKGQWDPDYAGTATPTLKMFGVSDSAGRGAARSEFADLGLDLDLTPSTTLGSYNFTFNGRYYFLANGTSEWINKNVSSAEFADPLGDRTATPGEISFVEGAIGVPAYFTNTCTATLGADCTALFATIFDDGLEGRDQNTVGPEPTDSRKTALDAGAYLTTACPADAASCTFDDTDVFDQSFTPTN